MLTPIPYEMNLIIMGKQPGSHSTRCAATSSGSTPAASITSGSRGEPRVRNDEPGPRISSDGATVSFEAARDPRQELSETGLIRVESTSRGTHISAYAGPPPETEYTDYCWGGCPGGESKKRSKILRLFDAECDQKNGAHCTSSSVRTKGPIDATSRRKGSFFIGDCVHWDRREINQKPIQISSKYQPRSTKESARGEGPRTSSSSSRRCSARSTTPRASTSSRFEGCPVQLWPRHVLFLAMLGGREESLHRRGETTSASSRAIWPGADEDACEPNALECPTKCTARRSAEPRKPEVEAAGAAC